MYEDVDIFQEGGPADKDLLDIRLRLVRLGTQTLATLALMLFHSLHTCHKSY